MAIMLVLMLMLCFCSLLLCVAGSLVAPVVTAILPLPQLDPVLHITVADLLHQELVVNGGQLFSSGAGFILDTTGDIAAQSTVIHEQDCHLSSNNTMSLTLYKSPCPDHPASKLRHVEVPVVCRDNRLGDTHYSFAALGPGTSALPRQIAAARGLPATFSYCLPPENDHGAVFFGARSYPYKGITMHKVPMKISPNPGPGFYSVQLAGVGVSNAEHTFPFAPFDFVVSSRERSIRLPSDAYDYIFEGVSKSLSERGIFEVTQKPVGAPREPCYSTTNFNVNSLDSPKIKLVFSNQQTMELKPAQYFFKADFLYCLTISTLSQGPPVIGFQAQMGKIMEFDLENETLGFSEPSPQDCFVKFA